MSRSRRFYLTEDEIFQLMNVDDSDDDERAFELDGEDIAFLQEDAAVFQPRTEIEINDVLPKNKQPSTSAASREKPPKTAQVACDKPPTPEPVIFKWKKPKDDYTLPTFTDPDFDYGKVLLPVTTPDSDVPSIYQVFSAVSNLDTMLKLVKQQSEQYAEQKGIVFSISFAELRVYLALWINNSNVVYCPIRI